MPLFRLKSAATNKFLSILGSTQDILPNNNNVLIASENWHASQKWLIDSLTNGVYVRTALMPHMGLNVYREGNPYNCDVYPIAGNEYDAKVNFIFSPYTGYYYIRLVNYDLYLTVDSLSNNDNVCWMPYTSTNILSQQWVPQATVATLSCPLDNYTKVTQGFNSMHLGIDYSANRYTPIKAADDGQVIFIQNWNGNETGGYDTMGHCVYVEHSHGMTIYMHMNENPSQYVSVGKQVKRGDTIGSVGITGNAEGYHLHFAYKQGTFSYNNINAFNEGTFYNPLNQM